MRGIFRIVRTSKGVVRVRCIEHGHIWAKTFGKGGARLSVQHCHRHRCDAIRVAPWYDPPTPGKLPWRQP